MPTLKLPTQGIFQGDSNYKNILFNFLNTYASSISSQYSPEFISYNYHGVDSRERWLYTIKFNTDIEISKGFDELRSMSSEIVNALQFYGESKDKPKPFQNFLRAIFTLFPALKNRSNTTYVFPMDPGSIRPQQVQAERSQNAPVQSTRQEYDYNPTYTQQPYSTQTPARTISPQISYQQRVNTRQCVCPCSCSTPGAIQIGGKKKTRGRKLKSRRKTYRR